MIVGVTGTGSPFTRLVHGLAHVARTSGEEVWVQHGTAALVPPLQGAAFVPRSELLARMRAARVVVCHGGSGAIADALDAGHVPVVVARRFANGEHVNDHQLEIVEALSSQGRVVACHDVEGLGSAVECASKCVPERSARGDALRSSLSREVRRYEKARRVRTRWVWSLLAVTRLLAPAWRANEDRAR